ncbi:MAG: hypothetical protein Q9162_000255 [Coniocarpon cinnabarinum]
MGSYKKESARKERQGKNADGMGNIKTKGENFYRNAKKAKRLSIENSGKARHNRKGDVVEAAAYQSKDKAPARIEPNRKWFGNTRVIAQDSLAQFREAVKQSSDPYTYLLKSNKLPMSLIRDGQDENSMNGLKQHAAKIAVEAAPFKDVFGKDSRRKRVKLDVSGMEEMAQKNEKAEEEYVEKRQEEAELRGANGNDDDEYDDTAELSVAREAIFSKGQSKRIWNELYKVIDSSDVLIQVLDARDPEGTRCHHVEKYMKTEAPHKHLLLILNKCDLVPTKVAATWVKHLSTSHPTLAFHSSLKNPFGKGSLISLLRQFSALHKNRHQISVGLIGYPNTGKSSLINTLRSKRVCKTAPIPGETKVWQYITLMKRIYLIDCPGVVPPNRSDSDGDLLLRGVVRVENVEHPAQYVHAALDMCERRHVERTYGIGGWKDAHEFLEKLAERSGKLLKGGERDVDGVAKMFLNDFLRGKVPWFVKPPGWGDGAAKQDNEGIEGPAANGEMKGVIKESDVTKLNQQATLNARKRKREDETKAAVEDMDAEAGLDDAENGQSNVDDDFESFPSDEAGDDKQDDDAEDDEGSTSEPEGEDDNSGGGAKIS